MSSTIHILVNKLSKMQGKIIDSATISALLSKISDETFTEARVYKLTYTLRNKGYLMSLKKNCFLCTNPNKPGDEDHILQSHYRELLKKHCKTYIQGGRYIGGLKALEFYLQNYEIPDTIEIINTHKSALEVVIFDKTVAYKTYTHQKTNIFSKVKKHLQTQKIGKFSFPIACIELALLESLHNPSQIQSTLINENAKKIIRKYKKTLNLDFFTMMLQNNKHHVGINRIYQLAKSIDAAFADKLHTIIKRYSFMIQ